MLNKQQC